jgi:sugar/nucleoside kinase (ribokinase family)
MHQYDLCGVGNALVDIEVKTTEDELSDLGIQKGIMTLIDAPRMIELLGHFGGRIHRRSAGGSAANTVITTAHFGCRSFYNCRVANDDTGHFFVSDLIDNGVDSPLSKDHLPTGYTGICLVMITPDADRTMSTYLGITADLSVADINMDSITRSRYLYIEGYLMAQDGSFEAAMAAAYRARTHYTKVAFTFSDLSMVQHFSNRIELFLSQGIDLLFCNINEALLFTHTTTATHAAKLLANYSKKGAITLGAEGALVWDGHEHYMIAPIPANAVDTNGAGDCFAGAFLAALLAENSMEAAGHWGCKAASELVTHYGPRLTQRQVLDLSLH